MVSGAVLAGVLVGLSAFEGTLERDSAWAHASVAGAVVLALVAAVVFGRGHQRRVARSWVSGAVAGWRRAGPAYRSGVVLWAVLLAAAVGWDLASFAAQSHDLPTLSRIIGAVSRHPAGRGVLFGLWLAAGTYLALGRRAKGRR